MRCELVTWHSFHKLCRQLAYQIRDANFAPDLIVAIARGGCTPARVLCDYLGIMNVASFRIEHYRGAQKQPLTRVKYPLTVDVSGQRVLVVDDVSDSGDTFEVALQHLHQCGEPAIVRTAAMHHKVTSSYVPDFYAHKVVKWRWIIYPWAVTEDLTGLIQEMEPRPATVEGIVARLRSDHGMRVRPESVADALAFMGSPD